MASQQAAGLPADLAIQFQRCQSGGHGLNRQRQIADQLIFGQGAGAEALQYLLVQRIGFAQAPGSGGRC